MIWIEYHGIYQFRPKRIAFRNDYCLFCDSPTRSVQLRTIAVGHFFGIPILPLGVWTRWLCTRCGNHPHSRRRGGMRPQWAILMAIAMFTAVFWAEPISPDFMAGGWICRLGGVLASLALFAYLLKEPEESPIKQKLVGITPASDSDCPFCEVPLIIGSRSFCPVCEVARQ